MVYAIFKQWPYLLITAPIITDWLEVGHFPATPRQHITEFVIGGIIAACIVIIRRDLNRLRAMANTDGLTGLYNRRKFMIDLQRHVALAQRLNTALSIVFMDIDNFKSINDRYGHVTGDAVLQDIASVLTATVRRRVDACYRLGGDEFAVILAGVTQDGVGEIIRHAGETLVRGRESLQRYNVSVSFGDAQLRPGETAREFLVRADRRMYGTKAGHERTRLVFAESKSAPGDKDAHTARLLAMPVPDQGCKWTR